MYFINALCETSCEGVANYIKIHTGQSYMALHRIMSVHVGVSRFFHIIIQSFMLTLAVC